MSSRISERRPMRLPGSLERWIESTKELAGDLHTAADWSGAVDYSEPVYVVVDLDAGKVDFRSRLAGPPTPDDDLDAWLMTPCAGLPVVVVDDRRRVLASFELPDPALLGEGLARLRVPLEFGGEEPFE